MNSHYVTVFYALFKSCVICDNKCRKETLVKKRNIEIYV